MRFPFVARATLEATERALAEMTAINARMAARYDKLLADYHDVVTRPNGSAPKPLQRKTADPVMEAIAIQAGSNAMLRRHLGTFAKQRRAEGVEDAEIVSAILHWKDSDEEAA